MKSLLLAVCALAMMADTASAQTKTRKWIDGMCESTVRYDSRKVDDKAMAGTIAVITAEEGGAPVLPFVSTPADIAKIDPEAFAKDCTGQGTKMRGHALLPVKDLETLRQERARNIDDSCALNTAYAKGYRDPSALRAYAPASPHCDVFIDALEGKSDLTAVWRKRIAERCADNVSPSACRQRYETAAAGPDGDAHKRLYLVGFGWGNCAIDHSAFNDKDIKRRDALMERVGKAFRKAYRVKEVCEQP